MKFSKKRVKKKAIKPFLEIKQQQVTNFFSIAILLLILISIIYFVNTDTFKSIGKASGLLGCEEDWLCSEWSVCSQQGTQVRFCYDLNACATEIDKPEEQQGCIYIAGTLPTTPEEQLAQPIPEPPTAPKKKSPWPYLIVSLTAVIAVASLGIQQGQRYKKIKTEMQSKQVSEDTVHELYMYALKQLKTGYERQDVQQAMRNEGWPQKVINQVFQSGISF